MKRWGDRMQIKLAKLKLAVMAAAALIGSPLLAAADSTAIDETHTTVQTDQVTQITIGNFAFKPSTLTVRAGTPLLWVNEDDVPHIVIGTDGDSPIKSQPLDTDDRYALVIQKPGTYKYFCTIHPHMVGTIVVQ